jgi:hypothetical protein
MPIPKTLVIEKNPKTLPGMEGNQCRTACVGVIIVVISSSAGWVECNRITGYSLNDEVSILGKRRDFSLQYRLQTAVDPT